MRLIFYIHHHHHQHLPCLWTWATIVLLMYGLIADTTTGVESVNLPTFYTMASNGLARSLPRQFWKSCIPIWWLSHTTDVLMYSHGWLCVNTTDVFMYTHWKTLGQHHKHSSIPILLPWVSTTDTLMYAHWMILGQHYRHSCVYPLNDPGST